MHVLISMNHTMSPTITLFVNSISFNYIILPCLCLSGKLRVQCQPIPAKVENAMKWKKKEEDEESDFKYKLSVFFFLEAMYTTNPRLSS